MTLAKFAKRYRVDDPDSFRIKDWDPGDTNNLDIEKKEAKDLLEEGVKRLSELAPHGLHHRPNVVVKR